MKSSDAAAVRTVEIELKLALPTPDPATLAQRLAKLPLLARRKASRQHLHNTYYDTPDATLNQHRVALRVRRVGSVHQPQWLQTLKIGGGSDSALSRRGEWEEAIAGPTLDPAMLQATPWAELDADGTLLAALESAFTTDFERTCWTVRRRDGSVVEVALDIGTVTAGAHTAPICELELELLQGDAAALFAVAADIARAVPVLPLAISKAERGYALARGTLHQPLRAQPPALAPDASVDMAAVQVLREMLGQFTANLVALEHSDDPEVVHQARVAWRRLRSGLKLFKQAPWVTAMPDCQALHPLLHELGLLRDLDVANLETLPMLANAYAGGNPTRQTHWRAMQDALAHAMDAQRQAVRQALADPGVGTCLLALTQWLEDGLPMAEQNVPEKGRKTRLRKWSQRRIARLRERLKDALRDAANPESAHRARILAKRLRYGIEVLQPLLPKRRSRHWYQQALRVQSSIGAARDLQQALSITTALQAHEGLLEFLRGVQARAALQAR
jgi:inorganic triphosphatase YgiF